MAKILYFARLAETLNCSTETLNLPDDCDKVGDLVKLLRKRGKPFEDAFGGELEVLFAVNQEMATADKTIGNNDEIAFFPPVTGG